MKRLIPFVVIAAAGCYMLPSVGPDYKCPDMDGLPAYAMPDAGYPTTNRTEVGEWKPAEKIKRGIFDIIFACSSGSRHLFPERLASCSRMPALRSRIP